MKILAFLDKDKLARAAFMGEVEVVIPKRGYEHMAGRKLFSAFILGMKSLGRYALARYVPRNSKNGVNPRLVVLMPFRTKETEGMYLVDLPTIEDVRDYPFNSMKPSTAEQSSLIS